MSQSWRFVVFFVFAAVFIRTVTRLDVANYLIELCPFGPVWLIAGLGILLGGLCWAAGGNGEVGVSSDSSPSSGTASQSSVGHSGYSYNEAVKRGHEEQSQRWRDQERQRNSDLSRGWGP
jgi:hypothetical protein